MHIRVPKVYTIYGETILLVTWHRETMASRDHGIAHRCIKICMTSWVYFVAMAIEQLCMPSMDPDAAEIMQVIPYHTCTNTK